MTLYEWRKSKGWSQEKLGEKLGMSQQAVAYWEKKGIRNKFLKKAIVEKSKGEVTEWGGAE